MAADLPHAVKTQGIHKTGSHNVSQHRQRRTDPRPQATCTKKIWWKISRVVSELCKWTDKQTNKPAYTSHYLPSPLGVK